MLDNRQLQALQLLSEGLPYKEIAKTIGIAEQTFKNWVGGDPHSGHSAIEFSEEVKKLKKKQDEETLENLKVIRLGLSRRLKSWMKNLPINTSQQNLENVIDVMKVLNPSFQQKVDVTQIYNINAQSQEDIFNEYRRLKSLAGAGEAAPVGRRVQAVGSGKPAKVSGASKARGRVSKGVKGDDNVSSEPEAGAVPPK